jgi:RNA polymerase sigma-70 factor (ECF subfamily)
LAVWFVAVARGLALERLRRAAGPSASAGGAYLPAETLIWLPTPEEVLDVEERLGLLQKIVNQLPQSQRRALELAFFEGPSAEGIAPALGVPMARAMAELRAALSFLRHRLRAVLGRWTADI